MGEMGYTEVGKGGGLVEERQSEGRIRWLDVHHLHSDLGLPPLLQARTRRVEADYI